MIGLILLIGILFALICLLVEIVRYADARRAERLRIICPNPNCGFCGEGMEERAFSGCLLIVLFCFGILPGVIYLLYCLIRRAVICPKCGTRIR